MHFFISPMFFYYRMVMKKWKTHGSVIKKRLWPLFKSGFVQFVASSIFTTKSVSATIRNSYCIFLQHDLYKMQIFGRKTCPTKQTKKRRVLEPSHKGNGKGILKRQQVLLPQTPRKAAQRVETTVYPQSPLKVSTGSPVKAFQIFAVQSRPAVRTEQPSAEKLTNLGWLLQHFFKAIVF